jgi:hypothetical protein
VLGSVLDACAPCPQTRTMLPSPPSPDRSPRRWVPAAVALTLLLGVAGAGAVAAFETDTVPSFASGLWWAVSLLTTVGFIGAPPRSTVGIVTSVVLMLTGFVMLALVSAAIASLFVREDERPAQERDEVAEAESLTVLRHIQDRLDAVEQDRSPARRSPRASRPARPRRSRALQPRSPQRMQRSAGRSRTGA